MKKRWPALFTVRQDDSAAVTFVPVLYALALLIFSIFIISCGGAGNGNGNVNGGGGKMPSSKTGERSVLTAVLTAVRTVAPGSDCPDGGIRVDAGTDDNGNGVLDPAEAGSTQYACNDVNDTEGTDGGNGPTALFLVTNVPAGSDCARGGKQISVGTDRNENGVLDPWEITSSDYACNHSSGR